MIYKFGSGRGGRFDLKPAHVALTILSVLTAGCSADIARFNNSSFNLDDPPQTASVAPAAPVRSGSDFENPVTRSAPRGPYGAGAKGVEVAALPDPVPPPAPPAATNAPPQARSSYRPAAAPAPAPAAVTASGETIEVQQGDTLYGLSRKHHVSLAELMSANHLSSPALKPGQKLVLPAPGQPVAAAPAARASRQAPAPASAPAPAPTVSADVAAKYNGTYAVKPGDSLYSISRKNKISLVELEQVNGITDPRKVRPGTLLKVPGGFAGAAAQAEAAIAPAAPASAPAAPESPKGIASTTQPTNILNGNKVAQLNDKATDAPAAAGAGAPPAPPAAAKVAAAGPQAAAQATDSTKLRWPVSGKVIAGFGGRPDGTHNDGVNLSVPLGTEVHAAESGVVAYSGNELKGYGNLILIRHDNGWVTAYAHNDELMVKRGDKVSRGQVVAKAGKTGTVDQPQVHFELRQGQKPVDPTPFMEKN